MIRKRNPGLLVQLKDLKKKLINQKNTQTIRQSPEIKKKLKISKISHIPEPMGTKKSSVLTKKIVLGHFDSLKQSCSSHNEGYQNSAFNTNPQHHRVNRHTHVHHHHLHHINCPKMKLFFESQQRKHKIAGKTTLIKELRSKDWREENIDGCLSIDLGNF